MVLSDLSWVSRSGCLVTLVTSPQGRARSASWQVSSTLGSSFLPSLPPPSSPRSFPQCSLLPSSHYLAHCPSAYHPSPSPPLSPPSFLSSLLPFSCLSSPLTT